MNTEMLKPTLPWWRVATVWLVIAGPALVVVAGVITAVIAVRGGDVPLLRHDRPVVAVQGDMTPAAQARNHAAAPRR